MRSYRAKPDFVQNAGERYQAQQKPVQVNSGAAFFIQQNLAYNLKPRRLILSSANKHLNSFNEGESSGNRSERLSILFIAKCSYSMLQSLSVPPATSGR